MLKLSKAQYKQLCADCAADMMRGAGHGGTIPDFTGTDMHFFVKDSAMHGGGFTDTLSSTWSKVKQFVSESPLAQKVVKQGLAQGKKLAKDVAGKAVQMGLEKLGVPESAMGTATSLAGEAFDRLGDAAEHDGEHPRKHRAAVGQVLDDHPKPHDLESERDRARCGGREEHAQGPLRQRLGREGLR